MKPLSPPPLATQRAFASFIPIPTLLLADIHQSVYFDHTAHHRVEAVADGDQQVHEGGVLDCQGRCTHCCCCYSVISMSFYPMCCLLALTCIIIKMDCVLHPLSVCDCHLTPFSSLLCVESPLILHPRSIMAATAAPRSRT